MAGDNPGGGAEVLSPVTTAEVTVSRPVASSPVEAKAREPSKPGGFEGIKPQTQEEKVAKALESATKDPNFDPIKLAEGFVEGIYEEEGGDNQKDGEEKTEKGSSGNGKKGESEEKAGRTENNPDQVITKPNKDKEVEEQSDGEPVESDKDREAKEPTGPNEPRDNTETGNLPNEKSREGDLNEIIAQFRNGDITGNDLLEQYHKLFGLPALNLREDPRYQELFDEELQLWQRLHPEPYIGKKEKGTQLTNEELDEWMRLANEKASYREDSLPDITTSIFTRRYPDEEIAYRQYEIYYRKEGKEKIPDLSQDPVWREMERKARAIGSKRVGDNGNLSLIQLEVDKAFTEFCRRYPEKARIYALFDKEGYIRDAYERALETQSSETQEKGAAKKTPEAETQEGGAKPAESLGESTGTDKGEEKETTRDEIKSEKSKEPETPEELKKLIEQLREEVALLRKTIEEVNRAAEEVLKSKKMLPENYEAMKKANPYVAVLLLLLGLPTILGVKASEEG